MSPVSPLLSALAPAARGPRVRSLLAALAVAVLVLPAPSAALADATGKAQVVDGDTLQVAGERVRLQGIDAPETRQSCSIGGIGYACGENAKRLLMGATAGKVITCKGEKRDRYGRLVAVCYAGDDDLNAMMVRDGWALAYRRYGKEYVGAETEARAQGAGMWQGTFVEPWEWRRQAREASAEARR